jgi:LAO/AO transport system kinase
VTDVAGWVEGVRQGDRATLARAITLVESHRPEDQHRAVELIEQLLPHSGESLRVGITGVPGVGKSTLIDCLGSQLIEAGHRVAVLAVDPSSQVTGGSILGDKTRMTRLANDPAAFVRPSPTGGELGGVSGRTRESLIVLEAAGYDVVLVETVGVGQSETLVRELVDTFLVLLLPGAGDELQGIKRGIMEMADLVVIHKSDGSGADPARQAAAIARGALSVLRPSGSTWKPPVLRCSGLTGEGVEEVWTQVQAHHASLIDSGALLGRRQAQAEAWMWQRVDEGLRRALRSHPRIQDHLGEMETQVREGTISPSGAAHRLLTAFLGETDDG